MYRGSRVKKSVLVVIISSSMLLQADRGPFLEVNKQAQTHDTISKSFVKNGIEVDIKSSVERKTSITYRYQGPEDGNGVYTYQMPGDWLDGLRATRRASGYRKFEYPNDIVFKRYPDGSTKIVYPDGKIKITDATGVEKIIEPSPARAFVCACKAWVKDKVKK